MAEETNSTVEAVTNITDTLTTKITGYMDAIEQIVVQYGGQAGDLAINVMRIEAGSELVGVFIWWTMAYICYRLAKWGGKEYALLVACKEYRSECVDHEHAVTRHQRDEYGEMPDPVEVPALLEKMSETKIREKASACNKSNKDFAESMECVCGIVMLIFLGISAFWLCNLWAWIGMFYPEAYAVHKLLLK